MLERFSLARALQLDLPEHSLPPGMSLCSFPPMCQHLQKWNVWPLLLLLLCASPIFILNTLELGRSWWLLFLSGLEPPSAQLMRARFIPHASTAAKETVLLEDGRRNPRQARFPTSFSALHLEQTLMQRECAWTTYNHIHLSFVVCSPEIWSQIAAKLSIAFH